MPFKSGGHFPCQPISESPAQEGQVQAEILVLHGELDSMVTLDDVASFREEMHAAKVEHEVIVLKMPNMALATRSPMNGPKPTWIGYNAEAEQKGLAAMYALLDRHLA